MTGRGPDAEAKQWAEATQPGRIATFVRPNGEIIAGMVLAATYTRSTGDISVTIQTSPGRRTTVAKSGGWSIVTAPAPQADAKQIMADIGWREWATYQPEPLTFSDYFRITLTISAVLLVVAALAGLALQMVGLHW